MKSRKKPVKVTVNARGEGRTEEVTTWEDDPTVPERDPEVTAELPLDDEVTDPEAPPRYGSQRPDGKKTALAVLEPRRAPQADDPTAKRKRTGVRLSDSEAPPTAMAVLTPLQPGMREPPGSMRHEVLEVGTADLVMPTPGEASVVPRRRTQVPLGVPLPTGVRPSKPPKRPRRK